MSIVTCPFYESGGQDSDAVAFGHWVHFRAIFPNTPLLPNRLWDPDAVGGVDVLGVVEVLGAVDELGLPNIP